MNAIFSFRIAALLLVPELAARAQVTFTASTGLNNAYVLLRQANDNYGGHRGQAMQQIRLALRELDLPLLPASGSSKREPQYISDGQLREAMLLLQECTVIISGRLVKHVNQAVDEINVALRVN